MASKRMSLPSKLHLVLPVSRKVEPGLFSPEFDLRYLVHPEDVVCKGFTDHMERMGERTLQAAGPEGR